MDLALQRRRLYVVMGVTGAAILVALIACIGMFKMHLAWAIWPFAIALVIGFASHGWLMLGVMRDKAPSA